MNTVLDVRGLSVEVGRGGTARRVVDGVDLHVAAGECLGIAGESGSGKSLTMRAIVGLLPRGARQCAGTLGFAPAPGAAPAPYRPVDVRGRGIAMVFQEPMTALNPTRRVGDLVADGIITASPTRLPRRQARAQAIELLSEAGIAEADRRARAFPHELSGGLRQRVMIAVALSGRPRLLLCDEPTTALDVTVQDQILGLLDELRAQRQLAIVFVTHDLGVLAQLADRIAVMRSGRVVEEGAADDVLSRPKNEYTVQLRAAAAAIEGGTDVPDPTSCTEVR